MKMLWDKLMEDSRKNALARKTDQDQKKIKM